jgi:hypothetical protein
MPENSRRLPAVRMISRRRLMQLLNPLVQAIS